uniref:Uncharacterized protein n=1 Tax=Gibberella zeae TaxID=5518 RepID=A0A4E9EKI8_GIBZA
MHSNLIGYRGKPISLVHEKTIASLKLL